MDPQHGTRGWTVMADPEGGEFCASLSPDLPAERLHGLAVDSADPEAQARWWAGVYGAGITANEGWFTVDGVPGMPILTMDFAAVPEPKTVRDRIHWDVTVPGVAPLVEAGAVVLRGRAATSAGTCWPTRRETSSARSRADDGGEPFLGGTVSSGPPRGFLPSA